MLQKQHIFSAIILILALALAGVTWSLISGTMVEIGFSKKKTVTQKHLRRRLRKEPFWPRFSLSVFLREADQKRWAVWAGAIWWWFTLLVTLAEAALAICGFLLPAFFSTGIITAGLVAPLWLVATALAFDSFVDPAHRKDPGNGDFECGVITAGALVGGLVYIVLNLMGLW